MEQLSFSAQDDIGINSNKLTNTLKIVCFIIFYTFRKEIDYTEIIDIHYKF